MCGVARLRGARLELRNRHGASEWCASWKLRCRSFAHDGGATGVAAYEFDWTAPLPALEAPFDVVLASDVLYDKTQVPLIANVVCSLLGVNEHPSTGGTRRLLLADRASGTARTPFVEKLKESGAAVVVRPFDSPLVVADDSASDVVLVEATWNYDFGR